MANERRRAPRHPLIAAAEIIEPQTNLRLRGRTSDLSLVGCYVEMRNALPESTEIRVQIIHNDAIFTALGVIAHSAALYDPWEKRSAIYGILRIDCKGCAFHSGVRNPMASRAVLKAIDVV